MKNTKIIERRSECPISFGLDIFGDKWTLLILRDIMFYRRTRFSDFVLTESIATNILSDRLNKLEKFGIIKKRRDTRLKNQYTYSVTKKGKDLLPLLIEMTLWGAQYDSQTPASKKFIRRARADKKALINDIIKAINNDSFIKFAST